MQQTNKQTNIFKNFTDTVGFIASLFAIITVLLYKNDFKPTEEIASFIELESVKTYVFIAAVFFISALANTLTRSLPTLSVAFSIFPVCFCYEAFAAKMLEKNPVLYQTV